MNRDTSKKSGKQSTAKKLDSSRYGFEPTPATSPVPGAFGKSGKPSQVHEDAPRSRRDTRPSGAKAKTPQARSSQKKRSQPL